MVHIRRFQPQKVLNFLVLIYGFFTVPAMFRVVHEFIMINENIVNEDSSLVSLFKPISV